MTGRIEKTVFISYRRTNFPWAYCVYQDLTHHGFDVFFDYLGIDSGDFEKVILANIRARAHFIIILTPSALERCNEPGDWLRREIKTAMDENRNIVPIMLEGFDFGSPLVKQALTGRLAALRTYNGMHLIAEYVEAGFDKLRNRFLNITLEDVSLRFLAEEAKEITESQKAAASEGPPVQHADLTAQEWFERGYVFQAVGNLDEAIRCYTQATRIQPNYAVAFNNRGVARRENEDLEGALADYDEAIRLQPNLPEAFNNRATVRRDKGDSQGMLADLDEAIRLKPNYAKALNNRGVMRRDKGSLAEALADYNEAIRVQPDYADAFNNRGEARSAEGDLDGALADYDEAIRLRPEISEAFNNRGLARLDKGDLEGALADFDEAIRLKPHYAKAHNNRGVINLRKSNLTYAMRDFQKALQLDQNLQVAEENLRSARAKKE